MDDKQPTISPQATLSIGEQFRLARQELNLSLEQAAQKVGLRSSILQHIENNEFIHSAIPPTFMQGYVRNYAKFLKLPSDLWQQINYGEIAKNDLNKNARTKKAVNNHASHGHWVGYLTGLVVIIVAGMTLLWWWENHQQSTAERDNLVETYVNDPANNTNNQQVEIPLPSATTQSVVTQSAVTPTVMQSTAENTDSLANPQAKQEVDVSNSEISHQINNVISANNSTQLTTEPSVATTTNDILRIEITQASCWISVKDGNRKTLAEKEYKQGEVLTFNNGEHYSLIIGAPTNVKISYKGQDIPLKVDGRVARLSLPQS